MATIQRNYGKERALGDILYNPNTKSVFTSLDFGFLGKHNFTLSKNADGSFDLLKSYKDKSGNDQILKFGKLFPVKNKEGIPIEGIRKGSFGLFKSYDKETQKNYTQNNDCVILTSHKLKESKNLGESGFLKVGYITGVFAIEQTQTTSNKEVDEVDTEEYTQSDEMPF